MKKEVRLLTLALTAILICSGCQPNLNELDTVSYNATSYSYLNSFDPAAPCIYVISTDGYYVLAGKLTIGGEYLPAGYCLTLNPAGVHKFKIKDVIMAHPDWYSARVATEMHKQGD